MSLATSPTHSSSRCQSAACNISWIRTTSRSSPRNPERTRIDLFFVLGEAQSPRNGCSTVPSVGTNRSVQNFPRILTLIAASHSVACRSGPTRLHLHSAGLAACCRDETAPDPSASLATFPPVRETDAPPPDAAWRYTLRRSEPAH